MHDATELRLARVIARLNVGGPAIQAVLMTDALRRRGYRSLLLVGEVPPEESSMEYLAEERGVTLTRVPGMSRGISGWRDLRALLQLVRIFRAERPTIVHTHTAKAGALGRLAAAVCRIPVRVHTFHGHVFDGYFSPPAVRAFLAIERFLARRTDRIIAISESQKRELVDVYRVADEDKVVAIPLGLDLDTFLAVDRPSGVFRQAIGCPLESPLVGWIGRMTAVKEPDRFLDVAERLSPHDADLRFVMVGDGDLRAAVSARARGTLGERCALPGIARSMSEVYGDLDLVVLTSRNEGTPVVLLEGMASARAFVATAVGGVRDLMAGQPEPMPGFQVYENGILADENADAIASATQFLLERPELRRKMGTAGRAFVAARFSISRLADNLDALYRTLLESKRGDRRALPEDASPSPVRGRS